MSEPVTEFQRAVVANFQHGRLVHLAQTEHYRTLATKLKKEPGTEVLLAILENIRGITNSDDAGAMLMTAELDVKAAMASLGALSMRNYETRRQQPRIEEEAEPELEMAPAMAM